MNQNAIIYLTMMGKLAILALLILSCYFMINIGNRYVLSNNKIKFNKTKIVKTIFYIACIYLVYWLFNKYSILSSILWVTIISGIIAYVINPLVDKLEKRKINRHLAVLIVYILVSGITLLIILAVLPKTIRELIIFLQNLPRDLMFLFSNVQEYVSEIFNFEYDFAKESNMLKDIVYNMQQNALKFFANVSETVSSILKVLIQLVLIPIFTYYFLIEKERILTFVKNSLPTKHKESLLELFSEIDFSMSKFVRGRMIMSLYVGVVTTVVLMFFGVEYAFIIGLVTCVADIIPYIGPFLGLIPAIAIAFVKSPMIAVWVTICFVLIQWSENNLIGPKILGNSTGLHPFVILLCFIIGGGVYGVIGMIFSVPIVAILLIIYKKYNETIKDKIKNKYK